MSLFQIQIKFENFIVEGNILYFTDYRYNYFGIYDLANDKLITVKYFDDEIENRFRLFGTMIHYDMYIYLIPFYAKRIYKINLSDFSAIGISLSYEQTESTTFDERKDGKFLSAHCINDKIYIFPGLFPAIAILDTSTDEITYVNDWVEYISGVGRADEKGFFRKTLYFNNIIYAPINKCNRILKFNPDTLDINILTISDADEGFSSVCTDGEIFYILSRKGCKITKWNEKTGCVSLEEGGWPSDVYSSNVVYFNGEIMCFPMTKELVQCFGQDGIVSAGFFEDKASFEIQANSYADVLYVMNYRDGYLYDVSEKGVSRRELLFDDELWDRYKFYYSDIYKMVKNKRVNMITESDNANLNAFLKML